LSICKKCVGNIFFTEEDIKEMAWQWWPIAIGTDKFWGGLGKQILFTDQFGLQVVVLQLKDENVWNYLSHTIVSALTIKAMKEFDVLTKEQKETLSNNAVMTIINSQKKNNERNYFMSYLVIRWG
jgi:hypothetical protein